MSGLPGVLAGIEKHAGIEVALNLALERGGEMMHVPRPDHLHADHPLVRAVGFDGARAIAELHTGECLYVPMARRALAKAMSKAGRSPAEIAARLHISSHTARRYVRS